MHNILLIVLTMFIQSSAWAASSVRMLGTPTAVSTTVAQPASSAQPMAPRAGVVRKATVPVGGTHVSTTASLPVKANSEDGRMAVVKMNKNIGLQNKVLTNLPKGGLPSSVTSASDVDAIVAARVAHMFKKENMQRERGKNCDVITGFDENTGKVTCGEAKQFAKDEDGNSTNVEIKSNFVIE